MPFMQLFTVRLIYKSNINIHLIRYYESQSRMYIILARNLCYQSVQLPSLLDKLKLKLIRNGSGSVSSKNFNYLCSLYNIDRQYFQTFSLMKVLNKCHVSHSDETMRTGTFIREMMMLRELKIDCDNMNDIITYLCTM